MCVCKLHSCSLPGIFMLLFGRDRWFCIGRARGIKYGTQCGETSTTSQWFKSRTLGMGMMHIFFCINIVVTD